MKVNMVENMTKENTLEAISDLNLKNNSGTFIIYQVKIDGLLQRSDMSIRIRVNCLFVSYKLNIVMARTL